MDRITLINRALARIGCRQIQSDLEPGPAGIEVVTTADGVIADLLSKHPWHFTKNFTALTRLAEEPPLGWRSAFLLPPDRLALPRAYYDNPYSDRPLLRFQIAATKVYTGSETLFAEYQYLPPPAHWPAHVQELAVLVLAAEYALEVREDTTLRDRLRRDAYGPPEMQGEGGQFKVCADLDAQAAPSQQPASGRNPLTDIRNGYDPDDARCGW